MIRLKLRPEVSTLDFNNGIILSGFRIPALITRRAETDVELRDGQSFAIAGLMNNISQTDSQAIPLLSKLPIIGNLFKSKADARRADRADGADHAAAGARRSIRTKCRRCRRGPGEFIEPGGDKDEAAARRHGRRPEGAAAPPKPPCRPAR